MTLLLELLPTSVSGHVAVWTSWINLFILKGRVKRLITVGLPPRFGVNNVGGIYGRLGVGHFMLLRCAAFMLVTGVCQCRLTEFPVKPQQTTYLPI